MLKTCILGQLENFIYQLIAISFLLSPSFLSFASRMVFQFQYSRPRDLDPHRSLRFWYVLNILFNAGSVWSHVATGPAQGRSIVLNFIGQGEQHHRFSLRDGFNRQHSPASVPSKIHLLFLDFAIIFLNMVLISIAYESSWHAIMPRDTPDPLLPIPMTPSQSPMFTTTDRSDKESPYALDLQLGQIINRLRDPSPPTASPHI